MFSKRVSDFMSKSFKSWIIRRGIQENVGAKINDSYTELKFDMAWGTIHGKLWGSVDKQPIVAMHGWMDNAASFDLLAPLLKSSSILAIDLPGHGLSSWLPKGIPYNNDINIIVLRSMVDHYGWNKIKFLGHSMGGVVAYSYAVLFPTETEFIISIDSLGYGQYNLLHYMENYGKAMVKFVEFEKKISTSQPSYSKDIALRRWMNANTFSDLDASTTEILFNRGASMKPDGTYYFTRDYRLRLTGFGHYFTDDSIRKMSKVITCPYLVLKASRTIFSNDSYWNNVADVLRKSSKDFRFKELEGGHHMHMTKPQTVANEINSFLQEYDK